MGKTQSTTKQVESDGEVNNNVVINETSNSNGVPQLVIIAWIICALKIFEFAIYIYNCHQKRLKKKYTSNTSPA